MSLSIDIHDDHGICLVLPKSQKKYVTKGGRSASRVNYSTWCTSTGRYISPRRGGGGVRFLPHAHIILHPPADPCFGISACSTDLITESALSPIKLNFPFIAKS